MNSRPAVHFRDMPSLRTRVLSSMAMAAPRRGESGLAGVLGRLCRTITSELPVTGAAVTLMSFDDGGHAVAGAADPTSARLNDLELTLGEGPGVEAFASRRPVFVADLVSETRWPPYRAALRDESVRGVFAFPLQVGAARLGVLDVFAMSPGLLDRRDTELALAFVELATESLLHAVADTHEEVLDPGLQSALGPRAQIYQAQGMVMVELGVSLADALTRMRAFAIGNRRALQDVASDIVSGDLQLG